MSRAIVRVFTAAALAAVALVVGAQPYENPPPPSAPRQPQIAVPAEDHLPNGLRVIVAERHKLPLVSVRLVVLSGAETDPPQRAGLASLTAGLLTRGTRKHSAPQLASAAEALGGSLDSGAGWHNSSVSISVTTPKLSPALALVAEVALQPTFAQTEIERLRDQSLDEMKVALSQPGTLAGIAAQRALFGQGAYAHPVSGSPASLPRITRAELQQQHARYFRPDNALLVFAGDIDLKQAMALARAHFGAWKAPQQPLPKGQAPAGAEWPSETLVIDMPGSGQAGVALALPAPAANSAERDAGLVTNAVLGMGYSSRLNQEIRIKRGLSYGARSDFDTRREAGSVRVAVQTKNPSAAEVVQLVNAELDGLMKAPVPTEELEARKASLIGSFSRSLETTQGLADGVASLAISGLPVGELTQHIARLQAIGPADVQGFAARHFEHGNRRVAVAGVASEFEPALKQAGPLLTIEQRAFDLDASAPPKAR